MEVNSFRVRFFSVSIMLAVLCAPVAAVGGGSEWTPSPRGSMFTTQDQIDFVKAVMDDLGKIGSKKTAVNVSKYITGNQAAFANENRVDPPLSGYTIPWASNRMFIDKEAVIKWISYKEVADKAHEKGNFAKEEEYLRLMKLTVRSMAFTWIHEDVHMGQYFPDEKPEWENQAYETQISGHNLEFQ